MENWVAYMKYSDNGDEIVPVNQIWHDKARKRPYQPESEKDFYSDYKYTVRSLKFKSPDGTPLKLKGHILRLAATEELLKQSLLDKRAHCPILVQRDSDICSTTHDEDDENDTNVLKRIAEQKRKSLQSKSQKSNSRGQQMTSFLSQYKHPSQTTNVPHSAPAPSGSQASSPAGSRSTAPSSPLSNTPEARDPGQMQKEIDELKRKLNAANELRTQDPFSAVLERLDRMEDRFNKIEERLTSVQTLETNVKQLEDTLKMQPPSSSGVGSSRASDAPLDVSSKPVDLGYGFTINHVGYKALTTLTDKSRWLRTLLFGVLGDNAATYRFGTPRTPGLKKFPRDFIKMAKDIFERLYLDRVKLTETAKEDARKSLGADLADRATAVYRSEDEPSKPKTKRRLSSRAADDDEDEDDLATELLDPATGELSKRTRLVLDTATGDFVEEDDD